MANARFNVVCPSCEANVSIRSEASIGKKVECPKCKYRFTVPEPEGYVEEAPKKAKKGKKEKSGKKSPILLFALIGVLAVAALGAGGFFLFGGDDGGSSDGTASSSGSSSSTSSSSGPTESYPEDEGNGEGTNPDTPPTDTAIKPTPRPSGAADPTNLLPGDATAVYHIDFQRLASEADVLKRAFFDSYVRSLFKQSLTFEIDNLGTYIHTLVGPQRDPFAVIQSIDPISEAEFLRLKLEPLGGAGSRKAYKIVSNPIVNAMSETFTAGTLFEILGLPGIETDSAPEKAKRKQTELAVTLYDDYTVLVSTPNELTKFLNSLDADGNPPFLSKLTEAPPPPPEPTPDEDQGEGESDGEVPSSDFGEGSSDLPGRPSAQLGAAPGAGAETRGGPDPRGGQGNKPDTANQLVTANPTFRTINPALKAMLNRIADEDKMPFARFVEITANNNSQLVERIKSIDVLSLTDIDKIVMVGVAANELMNQVGKMKVLLVFANDTAAANAADNVLIPVLTLSQRPMGEYLDGYVKIDTVDPAANPQSPGGPGGPFGAGGPSSEFGDESGIPGGPPPGVGGPGGGRGGVSSGDFGGQSPPVSSGSSDGGFSSEFGNDAGGPGGPPPGVGGPFGGPPTGFGDPGGFGGTQPTPTKRLSTINVLRRGAVVELQFDMEWSGTVYRDKFWPRILRIASQVKGRMAVVAGENDWRALAAVPTQLNKTGKPFPQGTKPIGSNINRYDLAYPPEQRVSFLAELLPYLGRNDVHARIDQGRAKPWYDESNLEAAEAWIPEFLDAGYPSESWRATHPLVKGRTIGGTNFVGIAGYGMDAARYDLGDPEQAKLAGMTGYGWGSTPADVKDGLSNTIYMMQVPPGDGRPWIAGGGATLIGIDSSLPDPFAPFVHKGTDKESDGTFVLMGDGSIRWLKAGVDPKVFKALVTRAGGDNDAIVGIDDIAPKERLKQEELQAQTAPKPTIGMESKELPPEAEAAKGDAPAPVDDGKINGEALKRLQGEWTAIEAQVDADTIPSDQLKKLDITFTIRGATTASTYGPAKIYADIIGLESKGKDSGEILLEDNRTKETQTAPYTFKDDDTVTIKILKRINDEKRKMTLTLIRDKK